jgi:hypothetical protein
VGLAPRFAGFVHHDPGQLLSQIVWLETDPQGRVYVQVGTGRKTDRTMLRFDRQGQYVDMVYPSNPDTLAALGKQIEEVWPFVARFDGQTIPHRPRSWPSFAPYSSDWRIPYPMRIAATGRSISPNRPPGIRAGRPAGGSRSDLHHARRPVLVPGDDAADVVDGAVRHRWTGMRLRRHLDGRPLHGDLSADARGAERPRAPGTIRKVDLRTGELRADFEYNGTQRRERTARIWALTQTVAPTTVLPERITGREPRTRRRQRPAFPGRGGPDRGPGRAASWWPMAGRGA